MSFWKKGKEEGIKKEDQNYYKWCAGKLNLLPFSSQSLWNLKTMWGEFKTGTVKLNNRENLSQSNVFVQVDVAED